MVVGEDSQKVCLINFLEFHEGLLGNVQCFRQA